MNVVRLGLACLALAVPLVLAGCRQDMARQPKLAANGPARAFADGAANRPLVAGTVPRDATEAGREPPQVTPALLSRGQARFTIFCSPCHGPAGDGGGRVVERGFPRPPSFHDERLVAAEASHYIDVIEHGYGIMFSYAARVPPKDRWAIVAYIRALQMAQGATVATAAPAAEPDGGKQ